MLILTRRPGQQVVIGDHIRVTVAQVRGEKVRLGIEAPRQVPVHRHEVYEALRNRANVPDAAKKADGLLPIEAASEDG